MDIEIENDCYVENWKLYENILAWLDKFWGEIFDINGYFVDEWLCRVDI